MKPVILSDRTTYNVIEGGDVSMQCHASGDPKPTVSWFKGSERVFVCLLNNQRRDFRLDSSLESIANRRTSYHRCNARRSRHVQMRSYKQSRQLDTRRDVACAQCVGPILLLSYLSPARPTITGSDESRTVYVNVNDTATLPCPARADPPPARTWLYEERKVFRGYSYGSVKMLCSPH